MKRFSVAMLAGVIFLAVAFSVIAGETVRFRTYKVGPGDTLSEIAGALKVKEKDLIEWNPDLGIHTIRVGQIIKFLTPQDVASLNQKELKDLIQMQQEKTSAEMRGLSDAIDDAARSGAEALDNAQSNIQSTVAETGDKISEEVWTAKQAELQAIESAQKSAVSSVQKEVQGASITIYIAVSALALLIVACAFLILRKVRFIPQIATGVQEIESRTFKEILIGETAYDYVVPEPDQNGRYPTPRIASDGNRTTFFAPDLTSHLRSLRSSLKRYPELLEELVSSEQLIKKGGGSEKTVH